LSVAALPWALLASLSAKVAVTGVFVVDEPSSRRMTAMRFRVSASGLHIVPIDPH
jgi:hypothetical protein